MDALRIATAQYKIRPISAWNDFADQVEDVVRTSADYGAKLLAFPEYFTSQLLSLGSPNRSLVKAVHDLATYVPRFQDLFSLLAKQYKIHIVAGTIPVREGRAIHNDSFVFAPSGKFGAQRKLHMTRFETEEWKISPGTGIRIFATDFGKLAVFICYDAEFPELVRAAARAGAEIIVVPSCTDNRQGWLRVRYCAHARAIENQVFVVQSSTVGGLPKIPSAHLNYGISSILTPSDYGMARDGVLVEGTPQDETIVVGDVSLKAIAALRKNGSVLTLRDSARSPALARNVKTVGL